MLHVAGLLHVEGGSLPGDGAGFVDVVAQGGEEFFVHRVLCVERILFLRVVLEVVEALRPSTVATVLSIWSSAPISITADSVTAGYALLIASKLTSSPASEIVTLVKRLGSVCGFG